MKNTLKKSLSLLFAVLLIVSSMGLTAFAAEGNNDAKTYDHEYDLKDGDVKIENPGTYHIEATGGETANRIIIDDDLATEVFIDLDTVVIKSALPSIYIGAGTDVTFDLIGESSLNTTDADSIALMLSARTKLTIKSTDKTGKLVVTAGDNATAIGAKNMNASTISIEGGKITANGGKGSATNAGGFGIGADDMISSSIVIKGDAEVTAIGGFLTAGIGATKIDSASSINISGDASVESTGGLTAPGIGAKTLAGPIVIDGKAKVVANGGNAGIFKISGTDETLPAGAGIGTGMYDSLLTGKISIKGTANVAAKGGNGANLVAGNASAGPGIGDQGIDTKSKDSKTKYNAYVNYLIGQGKNPTEILAKNPTVPYFAPIEITSITVTATGGAADTTRAAANSKKGANIGTGGTIYSSTATPVTYIDGVERDLNPVDDTPTLTAISAAPATLSSNGGSTVISLAGTNLPASFEVKAFDGTAETTIKANATSSNGTSASATLVFPANSASTDKDYTVKAFLNNAWLSTPTAKVTVSAKSSIPLFPLPVSLKPGTATESVELTADIGDGKGYAYQWYKNDSMLTGETTSNLLITKVSGDGVYYVKRTLSGTSTNSNKCTVKWSTDNKGTTAVYAAKDTNAPTYTVSSATTIESAVLTDAEKIDLRDNELSTYEITMTVANSSNESDPNNVLAKNKATSANYTVGMYLNIGIKKEKYTNSVSDTIVDVTSLSSPLKITLNIPDNIRVAGRKYAMIRVHNGTAEILPDKGNTESSIVFESDKFSTYAIAYSTGTASPTTAPTVTPTATGTPSTGDSSNLWIWIALAFASLVAVVVILTIMHKNNKKSQDNSSNE